MTRSFQSQKRVLNKQYRIGNHPPAAQLAFPHSSCPSLPLFLSHFYPCPDGCWIAACLTVSSLQWLMDYGYGTPATFSNCFRPFTYVHVHCLQTKSGICIVFGGLLFPVSLPSATFYSSGFLCLSVMRTKHLNWAWSVDLGSREETTFKSSSDISKQTEMEIMEMEFLSHLNELIKCGCKDSTATSSVLAIIKHVYNNIQESPSKRLIGMIINVQERGWRLHLNVRDD